MAGLIGILVVGAASFITTRRGVTRASDQPAFVLNLRVVIGTDLDQVLAAVEPFVQARELISMETAKQGTSLDASYETRLKTGHTADDLIKVLNKTEGVQSVSFERQRLAE